MASSKTSLHQSSSQDQTKGKVSRSIATAVSDVPAHERKAIVPEAEILDSVDSQVINSADPEVLDAHAVESGAVDPEAVDSEAVDSEAVVSGAVDSAAAAALSSDELSHLTVKSKGKAARVIDAQVVDDEDRGADINPSVFDSEHFASGSDITLDDYGRTIEVNEAERIKDRLNESFTEQFGTAAYSSALKKPRTVASQAQVIEVSDDSDGAPGAGAAAASGTAAAGAAGAVPAAQTVASGTALVPASTSRALTVTTASGHTERAGRSAGRRSAAALPAPAGAGAGAAPALPAPGGRREGSSEAAVREAGAAGASSSASAASGAHGDRRGHELFEGVDVESLASGLDVLKQIRDINERRRNAPHDDEDDEDSDYLGAFADFDDDGDDSGLSGMHYVREDDQGDDDEDDGYGSAMDSADAHDGSSASDLSAGRRRSHSTAVARSAGNIGAFIRAANMVPMLTEEEERNLARRLREFGDVDAARQLVTSHLRFVVSVARKFTGYGLPLADLIQEGNIGLMKAVKNYDPDVGRGLAAFASSWIKAEIFDYVIRNWRVVKVATTKAQRKLFFNLRKSKKRLGWLSESERHELAEGLGVSESDVAEMEARLSGTDVGFDLDEGDSSDKGVAVTLSPSSYLEDEDSNFAQKFENSNYAAWEIKKLREAMESLDSRSRHIIKRRWLDENKATLQELSRELGVSIERVRQLESNAMNKVKAILLNEGVNDDQATLALENRSGKESKGRAVAAKRTRTAVKKSAEGKGASARLKALPLRSTRTAATAAAQSESHTPKKRGRKKGSTAAAATAAAGTVRSTRKAESAVSGSRSAADSDNRSTDSRE